MSLYTCSFGTAGPKKEKKMDNIINFKTNYVREMKLVPINMGDCLLQFYALKCFFGVRLHGGSLPSKLICGRTSMKYYIIIFNLRVHFNVSNFCEGSVLRSPIFMKDLF